MTKAISAYKRFDVSYGTNLSRIPELQQILKHNFYFYDKKGSHTPIARNVIESVVASLREQQLGFDKMSLQEQIALVRGKLNTKFPFKIIL